MGLLRDVLDTIKAINVVGTAEEYFKSKKYSSISKRSAEGTLQFPVLVSRSMDIDTLQTISKALEREYSSFTQIVLTMSPMLNLDSDIDAAGYLKKFHQNLDIKTDRNDLTNSAVDAHIIENYNCFVSETGNMHILAITCEGSTTKVLKCNNEQLMSILDYVVMESVNSKFNPRNNLYVFKDPEVSARHNQIITENLDKDTPSKYQSIAKPKDNDVKMNEKVLLDNDVKKSNELVPTTLHIRVNVIDNDGLNHGYQDFIIGVKTTMHPINSDEMITNLINGCNNDNKFFNFIKWTTGETEFFKDFLFNIKEIKDDVVSRSQGASPWWITLKRKKLMAKMKDRLFLPNKILPNTTIVVSAQEVEFIKTHYGFDLMNPMFVDKIMETYFLLGFVVVDSSTQIAHFLFDGQKSYQSVTFNGLERENSAKTDTKEILKLMNKM